MRISAGICLFLLSLHSFAKEHQNTDIGKIQPLSSFSTTEANAFGNETTHLNLINIVSTSPDGHIEYLRKNGMDNNEPAYHKVRSPILHP